MKWGHLKIFVTWLSPSNEPLTRRQSKRHNMTWLNVTEGGGAGKSTPSIFDLNCNKFIGHQLIRQNDIVAVNHYESAVISSFYFFFIFFFFFFFLFIFSLLLFWFARAFCKVVGTQIAGGKSKAAQDVSTEEICKLHCDGHWANDKIWGLAPVAADSINRRW